MALSGKRYQSKFLQESTDESFLHGMQKGKKILFMTPLDSIKYHRQMMQTSFMAMDPITGEVKAWVGGIGFKNL